MTVADRIIIPLDVPSAEAALALVERLPEARFFKVGLELFVADGPRLIDELKQRDKRVFLELKFHVIHEAEHEAAKFVVQIIFRLADERRARQPGDGAFQLGLRLAHRSIQRERRDSVLGVRRGAAHAVRRGRARREPAIVQTERGWA